MTRLNGFVPKYVKTANEGALRRSLPITSHYDTFEKEREEHPKWPDPYVKKDLQCKEVFMLVVWA